MEKISKYIICSILFFLAVACNGGFNNNEANELLTKTALSSDDYDRLLELYEMSIDDAIRFSRMDAEKMTETDREEVITMFAIGQRLVSDESNLSSPQKKLLKRINEKGKEELTK